MKTREDYLMELNKEDLDLYCYALQMVSVPIDVTERQLIHKDLLNAVLEADKGNTAPLRQQKDIVYNLSLEL